MRTRLRAIHGHAAARSGGGAVILVNVPAFSHVGADCVRPRGSVLLHPQHNRADLAGSFGVKLDRHTHSLTDFGSQLTASLTWKLNDNVEWKSRIYGFTSYHRQEIEWENTFALRVSKYISANLFLFPRFDDANNRDENLGYWQFKEYSSLGFSYSF